MTGVAVVGFAAETTETADTTPASGGRNDAELLAPLVDRALDASGLSGDDIGVIATASSELVGGVVGSVMGAFDALPAWPPRTHTHTEADGAWAFYEAWVRLLAGEATAALVCAYSRPLAGDPRQPLALQADPYTVGPLGPGPASLAALQARAMIDAGRCGEADLAAVVHARRGGEGVEELLRHPHVASPLRAHDCSTIKAGAAAMVLATVDVSRRAATTPAWITGMGHRAERASLGARPLATSTSTAAVASEVGLCGTEIDVLEVHAPFSHQELLVTEAIGAADVGVLNPSGGALPADPVMVTGLMRIGAAAQAIMSGTARRAAGHATNGPCLQHNLLCVMERR